jgi:serine/threonine protein kinase
MTKFLLLFVSYLSLIWYIVSIESKLQPLENTERLVGEKYKIEKFRASGGFGLIYSGHNIEVGNEVAIKFDIQNSSRNLIIEYNRYKSFNNTRGFPIVYWYGKYGIYNALVIELLGKPISNTISALPSRNKMMTLYMIAHQAISIMQILHNKYILHHDVTPKNFLMGRNSNLDVVHIIDFGSSTIYHKINKQGTESITPLYVTDRSRHVKTILYCSIGSMLSDSIYTPLDDMESLGYTLISLIKDLPWANYRNRDIILESKETTTIEELCENLPYSFYLYFKYIKSIKPDSDPIDYDYLKQLFQSYSTNRNTYIYKNYFNYFLKWVS